MQFRCQGRCLKYLTHTGAVLGTVLVFAADFLRRSGASLMAIVKLADLIVMALSFRLRETQRSLGKIYHPDSRSQPDPISYVDREIGRFVRKLDDNGFFDNGMLVITGDHIPPGLDFAPGELSKYGDDLNRVPLVIIDRDLGRQTFSNVFGHDSLKAVIEYLNLKKFRKYEYQLIPFIESDRDRGVTVICPMHLLSTYPAEVMVSGRNGEHGIYSATGDSSEFIGHFLDPEAEKEVAGRVKWLKMEQ